MIRYRLLDVEPEVFEHTFCNGADGSHAYKDAARRVLVMCISDDDRADVEVKQMIVSYDRSCEIEIEDSLR